MSEIPACPDGPLPRKKFQFLPEPCRCLLFHPRTFLRVSVRCPGKATAKAGTASPRPGGLRGSHAEAGATWGQRTWLSLKHATPPPFFWALTGDAQPKLPNLPAARKLVSFYCKHSKTYLQLQRHSASHLRHSELCCNGVTVGRLQTEPNSSFL